MVSNIILLWLLAAEDRRWQGKDWIRGDQGDLRERGYAHFSILKGELERRNSMLADIEAMRCR